MCISFFLRLRVRCYRAKAQAVIATTTIATAFLLLSAGQVAASITHGLNGNSRVEIKATRSSGGVATVLFGTWADRGDRNFSRSCSRAYYSVRYQTDGSASPAQLEASNVCSNPLTDAGLLANGDVILMINGEMQTWRNNKKIKTVDFGRLAATRGLALKEGMELQQFRFTPAGDALLSLRGSSAMQRDTQDPVGVFLSLYPDGKKRWEFLQRKDGYATHYHDSWIGDDGSGLLHRIVETRYGALLSQEEQLVHIDAKGGETLHSLTRGQDLSEFENMQAQDLQRFFAFQKNAKPESLVRLAAHSRSTGGFDVLYQRKGGPGERAGHWLRRINASGKLEVEYPLEQHIDDHGLDKWFDFYLENDELVLLSQVQVTQTEIPPGTRRWSQNAVSWIPLNTGIPRVSRKLPLDQRYLAASMNSGDENRQHLQGAPGTEPHNLINLDGTPLVVGKGWVERKWALRLDRVTQTLPTYTEAIDKHRSAIARQGRSKRNKARRQQASNDMNAQMAASVGLSTEEYAALSKREQQELLVSKGDLSVLMAAAQQQGQQMQQAAAAEQRATGTAPGLTPEQQAQFGNIPGMTPEQSAQMQASIAQMQAMMGGGSPAPVASTPKADPISGKALPVDTAGRAFIEFDSPDSAVHLRIFDRKSAQDLFSREYSDGSAYEYIDFSSYGLPLHQIGITLHNVAGETLMEMTPTADGN